jgi:serine aminopeptidase S33 family
VLGSSFGGDVALTYAGLFPDHPGGVILANTNAGRADQQGVIEAFGRLGGPEAADVARRAFAGEPGAGAEFLRVCYPLYSGTPGWAEDGRRMQARMIRNPDVMSHYAHERPRFDPWSVTGAVRCPVLVLAGEDDPLCPPPVAEDLAGRLPPETTRLVRLPGARHTIFRDRPDLAFPAVRNFVTSVLTGPLGGRTRAGLRGAALAGGGGAGGLGAQVVADAGHDVAQVVQVQVGQGVEEQAGDLDVAGHHLGQEGAAVVGDVDEGGAFVVGTGTAGDQGRLLQQAGLVGQAAAAVDDAVGQVGHGQRAAGAEAGQELELHVADVALGP